MDITIGRAIPDDAGAIAVLRTRVADGMTSEFGAGHWSASTSKLLVLRQMRASTMLVARCGHGIVGTVRLATVSPAFDANAFGFTPASYALYVLGLAVASEWRRQAVGRMLMEAARTTARERGAEALWLDVYDHAAGAGPFYERCGFRRVGSAPGGEIPLTFYEFSLLDS